LNNDFNIQPRSPGGVPSAVPDLRGRNIANQWSESTQPTIPSSLDVDDEWQWTTMSEEPQILVQPYSVNKATLDLYTQQWLKNQDFSNADSVDVKSNLSSPELSSGTIQDKVKLALDLNPRGQISLSINDNQELKEFIELTCKTDLLTDKRISIDLNLVLNDDSKKLLHDINVNTENLIFRTDIKQAAELESILKKRKEGTMETVIETLRKANPHIQFVKNDQARNSNDELSNLREPLLSPLLVNDEISGNEVELRPKPFYDVQVVSLENDFTNKNISEILLIKKNKNTNQFELLDKVLDEKRLGKADFITSNYNEFVESLSSRITTVSDEASRKKIAALFIKSQVLVLSGIESHSFEKLSNDEFTAYVLNEHLLKSSFGEIIKEKSSLQPVSVDAYLPHANSSEQFSQAFRERFSKVPKTDDLTYRMLDFKVNNNQSLIMSIVDKFNGRDQAKSFVNEYFEQRFQLSNSNLEKPDSKHIFKEFVENIQGNYGISKQNLLEVIQSCEKYFADNNFPAIPKAVQDYLIPKDILIERVLTQSFKEPSFNNYSDEQKSLYIDLQQQSQKLPNHEFTNYITTNLFGKYFENAVKPDQQPLEFVEFASQTLKMIAAIDSSLEQVSVFKREPDLAKISTNESFQTISKSHPQSLVTNMLSPLDKTFNQDLPGYNQITNQVKNAFANILLENSSIEVASDTLVKLLQDSIPTKEAILTVPVYQDFNPDLYRKVISNDGRQAQVSAIPPRASNDELLAKILKQCEIHLADFAKQVNLSENTLRQVFSNSHLGKILETFTNGDAAEQQVLSKEIISSELERNFQGKHFAGLISPLRHEILNERTIRKQFLFAKLEPFENSDEILADINKLCAFITDMDSKDSPYKRFNGLVLDEASVESNAQFRENLNQSVEPATMKQSLFDEITLWTNWAGAKNLGIDVDKYKEFRIEILLMQRKPSSEEEIKEFVKLNLASLFNILLENNAETVEAIGQAVKYLDSNLTSDMQRYSLSSLNLEPSIKAALDTPANKIKNQMQTALEKVFTSNANIKLPQSIKDTNAPEIQFYLETQKLAIEMRLANPASADTEKDINNAIFGKLATYINQAAEAANMKDFNLLALRDSEKEFVANLLNNLGVSNKALDTYFSNSKAKIFETSVQNVFQSSSSVNILDSVNKNASIVTPPQTWDQSNVQALIDKAVIALLTEPDEDGLRKKPFGGKTHANADELKIPANEDIRGVYIEVSRKLINSKRNNPDSGILVVQDLISENGAFTQNIKAENPGSPKEAQALFYGQYKAFEKIATQLTELLSVSEDFLFLDKAFWTGDNAEGYLANVAEALPSNKPLHTEFFIKECLLADQNPAPSSNEINNGMLRDKLNLGKDEEAINSLALISLVSKGADGRSAVAQELKDYLETKNIHLTNTVDGGKIPYIDTTSTHTKLQAGIALSDELAGGFTENGLVKNAVREGIQAVINSIEAAHKKDSTVKLIADNYPPESLAEIVTKSIFGEPQDLNASAYKLYKDSGYSLEVLKQTETILVGLNNLAKAGTDFKLCPELQTKCAELNSSWEAALPADLKASQKLRLDFAITEEVELNKDDLTLVNAYVNLRKGFSDMTVVTDAEKTSRDSQNLRLIEAFKKIYHEQHPKTEYNAQSPAYLTTLEALNNKYDAIVRAHGTPVNDQFVGNITGFIKESDDLLSSANAVAKDKLIEDFRAVEIAKPQPATDEQITQRADAYVKTYNQMQAFYRQNPASFEDYIDKMVDAALNPSTKQGSSIAKANSLLGTFAHIIQVLDGIFEGILVGSSKANFTPLLEIYNEIRQEQGKKLY
jgi:hypothetical protein